MLNWNCDLLGRWCLLDDSAVVAVAPGSENDATGRAIGISDRCPLPSLYAISITLNVLCVPLGLMALGARPGCFT